MEETAGNGVGRLFEATGSEVMINNCFSLLRYVPLSAPHYGMVCTIVHPPLMLIGKVVKLD